MSRITMPIDQQQDHSEPTPCRPYLAVEKSTSKLYTVIVGRERAVLYFDPEDGTITHGSLEHLKSAFNIVRPYRAGEVLTYVQG